MFTLRDFRAGQRVQLHPALDAWMSGDKFGEVVKVDRAYVHVLCDKSGRTRRVFPQSISEIIV